MKNKKFLAVILAAFMFTSISIYLLTNAYSYQSTNLFITKISDSTVTPVATYTCPMHPDITSEKAGQCSKCGMDLVLKEGAKNTDDKSVTKADCCKDMEKCKEHKDCSMEKCKGDGSGCEMKDCPMMKEHKEMNDNNQKHDCMNKDENKKNDCMKKDGNKKDDCCGKHK